MDNKTFILALRKIVREELKTVIKQELTEILQEGLKPTISEMKQPAKTNTANRATVQPSKPAPKKRPMFEDNRWASVLNETDALYEQRPAAMNSFSDMMNESIDEISMTSKDAQGFGMMRQNMAATTSAPAVMEDPETGKVYEVAPEVQQALTRDYSALMKAISAKKGN